MKELDGMNPKPQKKRHCFRAWCITNLVFFVVFVAAIVGGSAWAFNTYVSPNIGGVKFGAAMKLMAGVYSANRSKIVTDEYGEEDLEGFYDQINTHLFLKVRSKEELKASFDAMTVEEKTALVQEIEADSVYKAQYAAAAENQKDAVLYTYYEKTRRYPITIAKIINMLPSDSLADMQTEDADALIATASSAKVAAAEETDDSDDGLQATLQKLLEDLHFDFGADGLLGTFDYTKDEDYAGNIQSVTLQITGKQIAAVIGEVLHAVLGKIDLSQYGEGSGVDLSGLVLTDYFLIPQVFIAHKEALPENPTQEQLDAYNKNIYFSATLELRIRKLFENEALQSSVQSTVKEMTGRDNLGNIALGVIKNMLPKNLFLTATVFPNDPNKQALIKINNYSENLQEELAKIINFVTQNAGFTMFDTEEGDEHADKEAKPMLQQLNGKVVDVFAKLEENGIPLSFVNQKDGTDVGLQLAHIQMLLQFMNAYDPEGQNGITPYLFMTVLQCLFSEDNTTPPPATSDFSEFRQEVAAKYGISTAFWDTLSSDSFDNLMNEISVKNIQFGENADMRVNLKDTQLMSLLTKAKNDGLLEELAGDTQTSAAAEADSSASSLLSAFSFSKFEIGSTSSTRVFSVSCKASLSLNELLNKYLESEEGIVKTFAEAFQNKVLSFGLTLYFHTDADGRITAVGTDENGNWSTKYLINSFNEFYSDRVIKTITTLIRCLNGEKDSEEQETALDSFSNTIENVFQQIIDFMSDKLACKIGIKKGALLLPSLYEVVQGMCQKRIDSSDQLQPSDLPTIDGIRNVLRTMYNSTYSPAKYEGTPGNDMLAEIQSAFYLKTKWTANQLFDGESNFTDNISGDSIDFDLLYADTRSIDQLRVNVPSSALADLIAESKMLDSLGETENDFFHGLQIVDCTYTLDEGDLTLTFIFKASLSSQSGGTAAAAEAESGDLSWDMLLPDSMYLSASILLHNHDDVYTTETPRFTTQLTINDNASATNDMFGIIKVLSGQSFDKSGITDQVRDSVKDVFEKLENNIKLRYGATQKDALSFPSVFDYLVDGTMGESGYDSTKYMVDVDISAQPDYYTEHPADNPQNKTNPEDLMWRLRELGAAVTKADLGTDMLVWQNGKPTAATATDKQYYNANRYDAVNKTEEKDFYEQMQAYYFFKNTPDSSWFEQGSNIFSDLINHFDETFNLTGIEKTFADATRQQYSVGLYNYTGIRYGALLSDKALAGLVNSQTALAFGESMGNLEITSLTLNKISDTVLVVEITVKMSIDTTSNAALPSTFYITTRTTRTVGATQNTYSTQMTLNRFAFGDGANGDFDKFLHNLAHIESLDLSSQLNFDDIADKVSTALQTVFDDKLANYIKGFGTFDNSEKGVGYIEFNNVYYEIIDKLGVGSTKEDLAERNKENAANEENIQQIVYKLHHDNAEITSFNRSTGSENFLLTQTDRAFANAVEVFLKDSEDKDYINDVRSIFFTGTMDNVHYTNWQTIIANVADQSKFNGFAIGKNYIVTTVELDLQNNTISEVSAAVSLLPQYLYATVVIEVSATGNDVVCAMFNDLSKEETDLLKRFVDDEHGKTDVEDEIKAFVNAQFGVTTTFHQSTPNAQGEFETSVGSVTIG